MLLIDDILVLDVNLMKLVPVPVCQDIQEKLCGVLCDLTIAKVSHNLRQNDDNVLLNVRLCIIQLLT